MIEAHVNWIWTTHFPMTLDVARYGTGPLKHIPVCQWSFDSGRRFHHVAGDFTALFGSSAAELFRRPVALIDDEQGIWAASVERIFSGQVPIEQWTMSAAGMEYTLIHIPIANGIVNYVAGFGYAAGVTPPPREFSAINRLIVAEKDGQSKGVILFQSGFYSGGEGPALEFGILG